jgi:hypothetical protein
LQTVFAADARLAVGQLLREKARKNTKMRTETRMPTATSKEGQDVKQLYKLTKKDLSR